MLNQISGYLTGEVDIKLTITDCMIQYDHQGKKRSHVWEYNIAKHKKPAKQTLLWFTFKVDVKLLQCRECFFCIKKI